MIIYLQVTDFLLFIGKLSITAGMGVASFFFFNKNTDLNYYLTPVIIIIAASYAVSTAFFGEYILESFNFVEAWMFFISINIFSNLDPIPTPMHAFKL